jgi:hypothetical protein
MEFLFRLPKAVMKTRANLRPGVYRMWQQTWVLWTLDYFIKPFKESGLRSFHYRCERGPGIDEDPYRLRI